IASCSKAEPKTSTHLAASAGCAILEPSNQRGGTGPMAIAEHPLRSNSAAGVPLADIDVSDPKLYQDDTWHPLFARLRREDPIHYCRNSAFGPYWSVTRYDDI